MTRWSSVRVNIVGLASYSKPKLGMWSDILYIIAICNNNKTYSQSCLSVFPFLLQMGNASETFLFVSRISKGNDFLIGTLYTIFGKWFSFSQCWRRLTVRVCAHFQQHFYVQVCCQCWGMGHCCLWCIERNPPWSQRSSLLSTWPSVTWACP